MRAAARLRRNRSRKLNNRLRYLASLFLAVSLFVCTLPAVPVSEAAVTPSPQKVGISYYEYTVEKKNNIENSTLFIGTYLIYLGSLTGSAYTDAMVSRETYSQKNMFYKSEVSSGNWRDIQGAKSLTTITPGGKNIPEEDLYELRITCVIGKDGVPKNPKGTKDSPYLDPDPHKVDTWTDEEEIIKEVGDTIEDDEETAKLTEQISTTSDLPDDPDVPEGKNVVQETLSSATSTLKKKLAENLVDVGGIGTDRTGKQGRKGSKIKITKPKLTPPYKDQKIASAVNSIKDKYVDVAGNQLSPGDTGLTQYKYECQTMLLAGQDVDRVRKELVYLRDLLQEGDVDYAANPGLDPNGPVRVLKEEGIPRQDNIVSENICAGVPSGYNDLKSKDEKDKMLQASKSAAQNAVKTLEGYVTDHNNRSGDPNEASKIISGQLSWVKKQKASIPNDEFKDSAEAVRQEYEDWLSTKNQENQAKSRGEETDPEARRIKQIIKEYEEEANAARDRDDLKKEKDYEFLIKKEKKKLENLEKALETKNRAQQAAEEGQKQEEELLQALGKNVKDMSIMDKAAAVCALNQFGTENEVDAALQLARKLLKELVEENNPLIYTKYRLNPNREYVSMGAIDRARRYTRFRYVRNDLEATMSRIDAGLSYTIELGSQTVTDGYGEESAMAGAAVAQSDPYIRRSNSTRYAYLTEADAQKMLYCRAEYIADEDYAVCVTQQMEENISKIITTLGGLYQ